MKIYLLSYAGGSSLSYIDWNSYFVNHTLQILDYRGHGLRANENLDNNIEDMAADISEQIVRTFDGGKFVIFGHSMGGIIGWLATWTLLAEYGIQPEILCLSACPSPIDFPMMPLLNDDEILQSLKDRVRGNADMYQSSFFKERIFPAIKQDYKNLAQYKYNGEVGGLSIPFYAFYGTQDNLVKYESVRRWEQFSLDSFREYAFCGEHFYFDEFNNKQRLCHLLDSL